MDFPCADNSCIVFTVLLLIMAASCVHAQLHAPQLTAISWGGQFYPGAIIHRRLYVRFQCSGEYPEDPHPGTRTGGLPGECRKPIAAWESRTWEDPFGNWIGLSRMPTREAS